MSAVISPSKTSLQWAAPYLHLAPDFSCIRLSGRGCIGFLTGQLGGESNLVMCLNNFNEQVDKPTASGGVRSEKLNKILKNLKSAFMI